MAILLQCPLATLAFFSLLMSLASLWICRSAALWGSFLFLALALGYLGDLITLIALLPIGALMLLHYLIRESVRGWLKGGCILLASLISMGLFLHILPGFHNIQILNGYSFSPQSTPISLWLNFDKPFIAFFILAWQIPLLCSRIEVKAILWKSLILSLLGILGILLLGLHWNVIAWDPKLPLIAPLWLVIQLFFVAIPEEAFFRGFLQKQLYDWIGNHRFLNALGSITVTSLIFTLFHILYIGNVHYLLLIFAAGLLYGTLFQWTKAIESSIVCHFLLNTVHFFFFTYPLLMSRAA